MQRAHTKAIFLVTKNHRTWTRNFLALNFFFRDHFSFSELFNPSVNPSSAVLNHDITWEPLVRWFAEYKTRRHELLHTQQIPLVVGSDDKHRSLHSCDTWVLRWRNHSGILSPLIYLTLSQEEQQRPMRRPSSPGC